MNEFWRWVQNAADGSRLLLLEGYIAQESWYDDDVTPRMFREALYAENGPVTVRINSPGGDVFAAAQIYNMLRDYPGGVTVHIDALAASAASVIAMAGNQVRISPVANIMIHNPSTFAWGDETALGSGIEMLREVKQSILNAYQAKTGLDRDMLSDMMTRETWMSAHKAIDLGFADNLLYEDGSAAPPEASSFMYDRVMVTNALFGKIARAAGAKKTEPEAAGGVPVEQLQKRLALLRR